MYDFSGYATKANLKCTDGRTIKPNAFKDQDGAKVPLVWQHLYSAPDNILGHAVLENRADGVYAYCSFNDTEAAKNAKMLVKHGDIESMSIYANNLSEQGKIVHQGKIREVSLVISPANPGARIDNVTIQHSDGEETLIDDEAIIYTGLKFSLGEPIAQSSTMTHADDKTVQDVFDSMTEDQKNVVYVMVAMALDEAGVKQSENVDPNDLQHNNKGGEPVKFNVFDKSTHTDDAPHLTHDQMRSIMVDAQKCGSLKEAFLAHAQTYGIENIDILFPDAKTITPTPDMISRDMEWVQGVLSGTRHTPFSRIKSTAADITAEEARARGYVKGTLKKEEIIKLLKRITTPTTIYKKQKLDRDDVIDITDVNVIAWLKAEMRMMLNEELARALLISDGREADHADKINEENIRPIYKDDEVYSHHIALAAEADTEALIEEIIRGKKHYKGSGSPALYMPGNVIVDMLLLKDKVGRRLYASVTELASALGVSRIIEVPVMENQTRTLPDTATKADLIGIMVNLKDYCLGADNGGEVSMFDDFDIDYNQYKYLIETRCSGTLTKPKSAIVFEKKHAAAG